jgi:hypothetical protein
MTPASGQSWAEVFFMKNVFKVLGIIALVTAIGLSFAGCDTGGGGTTPAPTGPAGPAPLQKTVYTWDAGDDSYSLEITEASNSRAAYTPKSGDTYVLTITLKAGGTQKSSGAVAVSNNTFTLTPTGTSTTFTITVTPTATNVLVTGMSGTITLEGGETKTVTETVTPVKIYETFTLKANIWYYSDTDCGESWYASIPLSDFTDKIPKKGDKFTFKLSGTTDTEIKWFNTQMECIKPYQYLGSAHRKDQSGNDVWDTVNLSKNKPFEETFIVDIDNDIRPDATYIGVGMINSLWQITGDYQHDNGAKLPEGTEQGAVMATIRNFRISLIQVEFADED